MSGTKSWEKNPSLSAEPLRPSHAQWPRGLRVRVDRPVAHGEMTKVSRDPDDDHVLACALAAKAELIVSGDKRHLLVLGAYQGIPIRTVSDALGGLTASSAPPK